MIAIRLYYESRAIIYLKCSCLPYIGARKKIIFAVII